MFSYDPALVAAAQGPSQSIADVLQTMQTIGATCIDGDGLKWFNWLYLQVTQAVEAQVNDSRAGSFADPAFTNPTWMAALDVAFANHYFAAIRSSLSGAATPGCWQALFNLRNQTSLARIQFALAGMNAHIN